MAPLPGVQSTRQCTICPPDSQRSKEDCTMSKWECIACAYVYDPEIGDPDSGIAPGTPFEDLPDDWICPECGVGKDMFEEMD